MVKEARKLLTATLKNCKENEDIIKLLPFLSSTDGKTKEATLKTVKRIISPKRKAVNNGSTLRKKDIDVMTNPSLIKALFDNILLSKTSSQILTLIEEPVLKYIPDYEGQKVMDLEAKINKAIAKRKGTRKKTKK